MMNYTRTEFDAALAPLAPLDWQVAVHVNGDVGIDVGLDAFERAKPMKDLASWVSLNAPDDATITAYQLDRWKSSLRNCSTHSIWRAQRIHRYAA